MVLDSGAGSVRGDLWRLHERQVLHTLDDYEGDEYERRIVEVLRPGREAIAAFVYAFTASVEGLGVIPSGDWLVQS